jgi:hypothetical protein
MSKRNILLLLVILTTRSFSQSFQWQAQLPKVDRDGFYSILLAPEITSGSNKDLSDIRLFGNEKETPYFIRQPKAVAERHLFKEYRIIENVAMKGCCTKITLENGSRNNINNISLIIRNADVRKKARLSGSDDLRNWYVIKERYNLEGIYSNRQTYEARVLDFPLSSYLYYRLEIEDSTSAPLQILQAGYYDTYTEDGKYLPLDNPDVLQKDSTDRNTYLWMKYNEPQLIDKLSFTVEHPAFYQREAMICQFRYDKRNRPQLLPIQHFELRSNQVNAIATNLKSREFCIVIANKDNPPLRIEDIQAFQLARHLVAYLKRGENYQLRYGNEDSHSPDYDLVFFHDSIPDQLPLVNPISIIKIHPAIDVEQKSFFSSSLWIWMTIVGVMVFLGYMSWRMVGELRK